MISLRVPIFLVGLPVLILNPMAPAALILWAAVYRPLQVLLEGRKERKT